MAKDSESIKEVRETAREAMESLRVAKDDETLTQFQRDQMDEALGAMFAVLATLDGAQVLADNSDGEAS